MPAHGPVYYVVIIINIRGRIALKRREEAAGRMQLLATFLAADP